MKKFLIDFAKWMSFAFPFVFGIRFITDAQYVIGFILIVIASTTHSTFFTEKSSDVNLRKTIRKFISKNTRSNIEEVYRLIREESKKAFKDDINYSIDIYLTECFNKSLRDDDEKII